MQRKTNRIILDFKLIPIFVVIEKKLIKKIVYEKRFLTT